MEAQKVADSSTLVFLTVSDDEIGRVCASVRWREGIAAVHCSGATELSSLITAEEQGAWIGGFHPMQMFANPDVALNGLAGCTVGVEAKPPLRGTLDLLARDVGCVPFALPAGAPRRVSCIRQLRRSFSDCAVAGGCEALGTVRCR